MQKVLFSGTPVTLNQGQGQSDQYQNVVTPVTLNQGQGQSDQYQNVVNTIYHHTKFESN